MELGVGNVITGVCMYVCMYVEYSSIMILVYGA